jgi:hypothetical protein
MRIRSVVMISRHRDDGFASLKRGESGAEPLEFMELLINQVADQADDVGRPSGNLSR